MGRVVLGGVGKTRVHLDGDCGRACGCDSPSAAAPSTGGSTGGENPFPVPGGHLPSVTIMQRKRTGYDVDGNPTYGWTRLLTARAFVYKTRSEWDKAAGLTVMKVNAVVPNITMLTSLPETAVLREDAAEAGEDRWWEITATAVTPDRIEIAGKQLWREQRADLADLWAGDGPPITD